MKINILDAHDRLLDFKKQSDVISQGCRNCIASRPESFAKHPFYIFAHSRTIEMDERFNFFSSGLFKDLAEVPTQRLIWSPRLTKPKAQTNSMLFMAYPQTDKIKIIWMIPAREMWDQYKKGNLTESNIVVESIYLFENNRKKLEEKDKDELPNEKIKEIMMQVRREKIERDKLKPATSEASQPSLIL